MESIYQQAKENGTCVYHQQYCLYHNAHAVAFDNCAIRCIDFSKGLTVHFSNGETAQWESQLVEPGYLSQFGIAITANGAHLFVQTWENGLFCLSSRTGEMVWRTESKRGITNIFVNEDTVLCHQHERALQLLEIHTGKVLQEKRPATAWGFTALDHRYILCQVTARRWEIIDAQTLDTVETFTHNDFTNGHTDYCIRDIVLTTDGSIQVSGFKNMWDTSASPAAQLPNLEFTHLIKSKIFEKP